MELTITDIRNSDFREITNAIYEIFQVSDDDRMEKIFARMPDNIKEGMEYLYDIVNGDNPQDEEE